MILCPACNRGNENSFMYCAFCGAKLRQVIEEDSISSQIAQLEQNLKELKLAKKRCILAKKEAQEAMRQIRAEYTDQTRQRGSRFQGGGSIGRVIRGFQTVSRDAQRRELANRLAPLEQSRRELEESQLNIERLILETEAHLSRLRELL